MTEPPSDPASFATTHWTRVLAAKGESDEARAALADLCETYYKPVHAFIRRAVPERGRADDLAQAFFERLLERDSLGKLERDRGKFRSYLLGAVKHYLLDEAKSRKSTRRGGKADHVSIDEEEESIPDTTLPEDAFFDRQWAMTVLARTLDRVDELEQGAGRGAEFEVLKPWLTGELGEKTQAGAAAELDSTEGAVKVAVHRLRKRFRETLRFEISQTKSEGTDPKEEQRYLIEVLAAG